MKTPHRIFAFGLALVLSLGASLQTLAETPLPKGVTAGPSIEGISEYTLPNGLRVLLFPDASKPTVTVNLVYGVGSVHENYGETGMAHLLEHLLFKGTPTHSDISGELKKRGIEFNATTSLDRTNYFSSFPANDGTLAWVLGMEADRMVNSNVAKKDLDSEMTVVRNEMESRENNPGGVLFERLRSTAFLWHNYGKSTIGARSDVEGVPIERLQAFYRQWYQPDNATLIIAGRIDPAETLALVNTHLGKVKKPGRTLPAYYTVEPTQDGEREVTIRRVGDLNLTAAAYHIPSVAHADNAALSVLGNLLGHTPGGRLHKSLVETKLAAGSGAFAESMRDAGLFGAYAVLPKGGDMAATEVELIKQIEQLGGKPVTQAEVDEAKQRIANAYDLYFTDVNAVGMGLSEYLAAGDWRLLFISRDAVEKVTAEDVNRVAAQYLKSSNRTLARFVPTDKPDRAEIPAAPAVATLVEGYTGRAVVAAGENFDPSPQNLQARTETFTLGNGLKVSLLPKKTRGETVVVNAQFRFGDEQSISGHVDAANFAGSMLMRGTKNFSRQEIDQRFENLKTQASISGGIQGAVVTLNSRKGNLTEALSLVSEILKYPAFSSSEFEQLRLQSITDLEFSRKEPHNVADMALSRHFDQWPVRHPMHVRTVDQSLDAIRNLSLTEVRDFHGEFYGTEYGEIAIVGDFDPTEVRKSLESLFLGWVSPNTYAPISTRHASVKSVNERLETPDKPNAVLMARQNLSLKVIDEDYPALTVASYIFGGGAMKSRLGDRLRQKEGLSYDVSSIIRADDSIDGKDDAGYLIIQAISAPENMGKVELGVKEELTNLVAQGITADELKDAVSSILTLREQSLADDGNVASLLAGQLYFGRTLQFTERMNNRYKSLTLDQVNTAIKKHINAGMLSTYAAGSFENIKNIDSGDR